MAIDMGTDDPTPIRSASEKLISIRGKARFTAAKACSPKNCPTNTPSNSPQSDETTMLIAPGTATVKNSRRGGVLMYRS